VSVADDPIGKILRTDPRYPRAAYDFVREALQHTVDTIGTQRHVSARELLAGIRDYARKEFGPLARTVFASWNVTTTGDFGNIVFNLVEAKEMGKTDEDKSTDFEGVYDFETAFPTDTGPVEVQRDDEDE
jgi:uncharacterized repeat protein (TIGR04138 family)